jgi:hypothetical protein
MSRTEPHPRTSAERRAAARRAILLARRAKSPRRPDGAAQN